MASIRQEGTYLGTTLVGFTALSAGFVGGGGLGMIISVLGAGLLVVSAIGFYRIKSHP